MRRSYWELSKHFLMAIHNLRPVLVPYLRRYILSFAIEDDVDVVMRELFDPVRMIHPGVYRIYFQVNNIGNSIEYEIAHARREQWGISITRPSGGCEMAVVVDYRAIVVASRVHRGCI